MTHEVFLPEDLTSEGTVENWFKHEGDQVRVGDLLVQVECQKATVDVPSPFDGYLLKICLAPGEAFEAGAVIALISDGNGAG